MIQDHLIAFSNGTGLLSQGTSYNIHLTEGRPFLIFISLLFLGIRNYRCFRRNHHRLCNSVIFEPGFPVDFVDVRG